MDREEFFAHLHTAMEIAGGGTFRGPLAIYDLVSYVRKLSSEVFTPPVCQSAAEKVSHF